MHAGKGTAALDRACAHAEAQKRSSSNVASEPCMVLLCSCEGGRKREEEKDARVCVIGQTKEEEKRNFVWHSAAEFNSISFRPDHRRWKAYHARAEQQSG